MTKSLANQAQVIANHRLEAILPLDNARVKPKREDIENEKK